MVYAGFWKRVAAKLIDIFILAILGMVAGGIAGFIYGVSTGTAEGAEIVGSIVGYLAGWIYNAAFESSAKQATLGKMALSIKVTDLANNRISFAKASGRFLGSYISGFILGIGYLMVAFTEKKQGLHDIMAGCLVVNSQHTVQTS